VIEDLTDAIGLLDRQGRYRRHVAGSEHRITPMIKGWCPKMSGYPRAQPLGEAEPEEDRAQTLDPAWAQSEVRLYLQDPAGRHLRDNMHRAY